MDLLVLGGTRFLGRAVVAAALDQGATVTTFTRGVSGEPPAGVEALRGDRTEPGDLEVLRGRRWDLVIDTSGYVPRDVGRVAELLAGNVGHYVFVSTLNAYPNWPAEPIHADSPTHDCPPDAGPDDAPEDQIARYGYHKVGCERAVERYLPGRSLLARAGMIVGPHDDSLRLPWWLDRVARGGETLAPGDPERRIALIDARDLADWFLTAADRGLTGPYVATAPAGQVSFGELLETCRDVTGSDATFTWVPDRTLLEHDVAPWLHLPLWLPATEYPNAWDVDAEPARAAGLTPRPVRDTLADTWAWRSATADPAYRLPAEAPRPGLDPDTEREILAAVRDGVS